MESAVVFNELGNIANITYVDRKKQKEKYDKERKLEILGIILGIIAPFTIFLGLGVAAIADTTIAGLNLSLKVL